MKQRTQSKNAAGAQRWARWLCARVEKILAAHPSADRDNVRHTLILLEQPPFERLQRSLIRGRATAIFQKDKLTIPVLRDALAATQSIQRRTRK
jgi:hypothetical protein